MRGFFFYVYVYFVLIVIFYVSLGVEGYLYEREILDLVKIIRLGCFFYIEMFCRYRDGKLCEERVIIRFKFREGGTLA